VLLMLALHWGQEGGGGGTHTIVTGNHKPTVAQAVTSVCFLCNVTIPGTQLAQNPPYPLLLRTIGVTASDVHWRASFMCNILATSQSLTTHKVLQQHTRLSRKYTRRAFERVRRASSFAHAPTLDVPFMVGWLVTCLCHNTFLDKHLCLAIICVVAIRNKAIAPRHCPHEALHPPGSVRCTHSCIRTTYPHELARSAESVPTFNFRAPQ
jgi:hypothetical protein